LRACYPSGRYGTKGLVVRWFTDGREPRGTDNEPSGNRSREPHAWLTDVLTRRPEWPEERLAELLPLEGFTFFG
ncbi:transposase domain-containing protein, partial [Escherichia coli]